MNLPHEIMIEICKYLSIDEISALQNIYNDSHFWITKAKHDYEISLDDFHKFMFKENKDTYDYFYHERYTYDELRYLASKYKYFFDKLFHKNNELINKYKEIEILFPLSLDYSYYFEDYQKDNLDIMKRRKCDKVQIIINNSYSYGCIFIKNIFPENIPPIRIGICSFPTVINDENTIKIINKVSLNLDISISYK